MSERKYSVATIGLKIDGFLETILNDAGLKLQYEIRDVAPGPDDFETPDVAVNFEGSDVDMLLANRGELLLALELVTMEMLRLPSDDHSRLAFDANDYRLLRIEELRMSADVAAEKVKHTGSPFHFNPMNSRERRVIHLALRSDTAIRSESAGTGPARHVIVYPAGMASLPEPPGGYPIPRHTSAFADRPEREHSDRDRGRGGRGDRGDRGGRGDRGRGGRSGDRGRGPRR